MTKSFNFNYFLSIKCYTTVEFGTECYKLMLKVTMPVALPPGEGAGGRVV